MHAQGDDDSKRRKKNKNRKSKEIKRKKHTMVVPFSPLVIFSRISSSFFFFFHGSISVSQFIHFPLKIFLSLSLPPFPLLVHGPSKTNHTICKHPSPAPQKTPSLPLSRPPSLPPPPTIP
jgi:hypothetical protein